MKKVYLLGLALMVGGLSANAQRTAKTFDFNQNVAVDVLDKKNTPKRTLPSYVTDRALVSMWSEDFTGATGFTTANGTYTAGGTDAGYWTVGSSPFTGFGNAPEMAAPMLVWNSYTPINGAGEPGGFASTATDGSITTPVMNLSSSTTGALLKIDMDAMYCCNYQEEPYRVQVSNDAGATWSAPMDLVSGVDRNVATNEIADPYVLFADISSGLDATPANNNDCQLRFIWDGTVADPNGQYNSHYVWLIDNIEVFEVPPYEANHQRLWLDDIALSYEYGDISIEQAQNLTVQSRVFYLGGNTPTNFAQEVTVYDASMAVVHGPEAGGTLTGPLTTGEVDSITFTTTLDMATLAVGTYTVRTVLTYDETDEVPENDTLWRTFNITDNFLSHVDYDQTPSTGNQSTDTKAEIGASFPIYANTTLHGIDVYIDNANAGDQLQVLLYQDNSVTQLQIDYVAGPYTFDVTAGMIGGWTTLNLHQALEAYSPIPLAAGNIYVPVIVAQQGQIFDYRVNPIDEDNSGIFYHDNDGTWYSTGDDPWIGINTDQSLAIDSQKDLDFAIGQNVPNPFDNNSVITYTLENAAKVAIDFKDVSGKVVKTINNGSQSAGSYTLNVDAADFAEGVYFYTFTIGEKQVTKRMVVTK